MMSRDRIIQLVAAIVVILSTAAGGSLLPSINDQAEDYALRYTDVAVEGAPPWVAMGTMVGAMRGVIVDYLWIKVNYMKEKGLFYEIMADSEMITKLQPRFAPVWAFHGHNMAYNISVAMNTQEERWEWVNAGIRLVREQGLRHNPNDLILYKELAFWLAHKIDGVSDDAHLYYKTAFCREWHDLLGRPPASWDDRIAWIKEIADAPDTLKAAVDQYPEIEDMIQDLNDANTRAGNAFALDTSFLRQVSDWHAISNDSGMASLTGFKQRVEGGPLYQVVKGLITDESRSDAWRLLLAHVRKRILKEEYNMDPQKMYEYTRDLGPIDWRIAQAHALYWSRLGSQIAERRQANDDDVYKIVNNDRLQLQAMQHLARFGNVYFDPFSPEMPARLPDPRWVEAIMRGFDVTYVKHYHTRGAGADGFLGFYENFMSSACREAYRRGDRERAQRLLEHLDSLFGRGAKMPHNKYADLEMLVRNETMNEYHFQPALAVSDISASLRYAYLYGVLNDEPTALQEALAFSNQIRAIYLQEGDNVFTTKFGRGRMQEIVMEMDAQLLVVFVSVMLDPSINLQRRMELWRKIDQYDPNIRPYTYDDIEPYLAQEFQRSPFSRLYTMAQVLPEPPGLAQARQAIVQAQAARNEEIAAQQAARDAAARKN